MIVELIINTISALLGSLLIIFFFTSIFGSIIEPKNKLAFLVLFSLINGTVSTLMASIAIKPVFLLVISIAIIIVLLKVSLMQSFLSFALYTIGLAIGNALMSVAASIIINDVWMEAYRKSISWQIIGNLFANAFAFLFFLIIKPFKYFVRVVNRNKFLYILTALTLLVIASSFALHYYMNAFNFLAYVIISIIIISYCIFTVLVWFTTLRKTIYEEELAHQKFYNESLHGALFELRRFKHDWGNNMTVIHSMLQMNKISDLKQYVSELIVQNSEQKSTEIYNIKNAGLFGIISSKISQAYEIGVNVELSVVGEIENIPGIKISELCEILGIFLDNAIEEAEKADKTVSVKLQKTDGFIELSVSNSCLKAPDLRMICKEGYSTKGENRGLGLAIAKKIIEKYKNVLHITSYEENIFTQTIEIIDGKG
jgi:two-component system sensor histidine kinase AgrC